MSPLSYSNKYSNKSHLMNQTLLSSPRVKTSHPRAAVAPLVTLLCRTRARISLKGMREGREKRSWARRIARLWNRGRGRRMPCWSRKKWLRNKLRRRRRRLRKKPKSGLKTLRKRKIAMNTSKWSRNQNAAPFSEQWQVKTRQYSSKVQTFSTITTINQHLG